MAELPNLYNYPLYRIILLIQCGVCNHIDLCFPPAHVEIQPSKLCNFLLKTA